MQVHKTSQIKHARLLHDIFVHNNNNNSNKCLRTHVFNVLYIFMNRQHAPWNFVGNQNFNSLHCGNWCFTCSSSLVSDIMWHPLFFLITWWQCTVFCPQSIRNNVMGLQVWLCFLDCSVWASIIQCDCTVGSRAAAVVNFISLSNMSHMLPFWKRHGSCHSLFDLFGTWNLRRFRAPTVPEEMKFAKYPSACGEDLHLKFQTRAWASEPQSLRPLRAGSKVDSLAHWAWLGLAQEILKKFWAFLKSWMVGCLGKEETFRSWDCPRNICRKI